MCKPGDPLTEEEQRIVANRDLARLKRLDLMMKLFATNASNRVIADALAETMSEYCEHGRATLGECSQCHDLEVKLGFINE